MRGLTRDRETITGTPLILKLNVFCLLLIQLACDPPKGPVIGVGRILVVHSNLNPLAAALIGRSGTTPAGGIVVALGLLERVSLLAGGARSGRLVCLLLFRGTALTRTHNPEHLRMAEYLDLLVGQVSLGTVWIVDKAIVIGFFVPIVAILWQGDRLV